MPITQINKVKSIVGAIKYVTEEQSHDGIHERIGAISCMNTTRAGGVNNALRLLDKYNKMNAVQGYSLIQSYSTEELNPDSQEDIDKANEIAIETARRMWGESHQVIAVTQADNGKVHSHIIVVSPDITTGKSLRGKETSWYQASKVSDDITKEFGVQNLNEGKAKRSKVKKTIGEIKREQAGEYVWKADLINRIDSVIHDPDIEDIDSWMEKLNEVGVGVRERGQQKNLSYDFTDKDGKQRTIRASNLGTDYMRKAINERLKQPRIRELERATTRDFESVRECKYSSDTMPRVHRIYCPKPKPPERFNNEPSGKPHYYAGEPIDIAEIIQRYVRLRQQLKSIADRFDELAKRSAKTQSRQSQLQRSSVIKRKNKPTYTFDFDEYNKPKSDDYGFDF